MQVGQIFQRQPVLFGDTPVHTESGIPGGLYAGGIATQPGYPSLGHQKSGAFCLKPREVGNAVFIPSKIPLGGVPES